MGRIDIEKQIIREITPLLDRERFKFTNQRFSGEHYAEFTRKEGIVEFIFSMVFMKYGNVDFFLEVNYEILGGKYKIFSVCLRRYLNPKNYDNYFRTGLSIPSPFKNEIMEGRNISMVVHELFEIFYLKCVPAIISKTNSLNKVHQLLNNIEDMFVGPEKVKMLIFSTSYPSECLSGTLVAQGMDAPEKGAIFTQYLNYADYFNAKYGENETIDQLRQTIQKFSNTQC